MTNLEWASNILQTLANQGLKQVCLCAGSRNSPFIEILDQQSEIKVFSFFEEREAGFFAYQQIKEHQTLTAVITTSGTAVAELLPACIESYYKNIPLIIISADRPKSFRGSGAPQSIEQVGIFSAYATSIDLDINDPLNIKLKSNTPNHINICFDEPLINGSSPDWVSTPRGTLKSQLVMHSKFSGNITNPLIIVGDIVSIEEEMAALDFLSNCKAPILLESISNLRGKLNPEFVLTSHDLEIEKQIENKNIQSIVRLGGVPTTSLWRKLIRKYKDLPIYNFSHSPFSGLVDNKNMFSYSTISIENSNTKEILNSDKEVNSKVTQLFKKYPRSEAAMLSQASKQLDENDTLYLGNSLPIREWDLFTDKQQAVNRVGSNRGANGIDGQLSSFLGFSHPHKRNIGIFGDLTTMYGLSAPWILAQLPQHQIHIFVIINNSGGQIFSRMYDSKTYINAHSFQFENWASLWRLPYFPMKQIEALPHTNAVVEIFPDPIESDLFWKELRQ